MPSEGWLDTSLPKTDKADWLSPSKGSTGTLQTLETLKEKRQEDALKPKEEPFVPPPPPAAEEIPYKSVATAIEAAAKSLLDASIGVKKSEVNLSKSILGVNEGGPKGREIAERVIKFKAKITSLYSEMESLSNEMGLYKVNLPTDSKMEQGA